VAGDSDSNGTTTDLNAGAAAVTLETQNNTSSNAEADAVVKMTGDKAAAGVGVSAAFNVVVNTARAEVEDGVVLTNVGDMTLSAEAAHVMTTKATGGASGAKVSVTPLIAVSVAVNNTKARLGAGAGTDLTGGLTISATQANEVTTTTKGQTSGDVAVGASLSVGVASDSVSASVERNITSSTAVDLDASSKTAIKTKATASAKGAAGEEKDENGNQKKGTSTDDQVNDQLGFGKSQAGGKADGIEAVSAETPETETPDTQDPETQVPKGKGKKEKAKKVSVAAAIGVSVAENKVIAQISDNKKITTSGAVSVDAKTDTNYTTKASGEAKSDDVGVGAAVALTVTRNQTIAAIGSGASVTGATDISLTSDSKQNRDKDYLTAMSAESVAGASGGEVAVAGSLAAVANFNETRASIGDGADIDASGDVTVISEDTSKIAAQARAGAVSTGDKSKAGVGASFAVLYANNDNIAAVGYDANGDAAVTTMDAKSLTVRAKKNRVEFNPIDLNYKNFSFDSLNPSTYLGSNNFYTEAVAGAAAKGNAAVAGAFAINVFDNTTEAYVGKNAVVNTTGSKADDASTGVEIDSRADIQAIAFAGAAAGAKKAGVGVSLTNITNLDKTRAYVGKGATVNSLGADAGVKVNAEATQTLLNIGVSGGLATGGTGVSGVLGLVVSKNDTGASIGDGATLASEGDLAVTAVNNTDAVMIAGGVAVGKSAGVGGTVAVNVNLNTTTAKIGKDATTDAAKKTTVGADADESSVAVVVAGAGGGKAGVAGAFSFNVIKTDTQAFIDEGAWVNKNVGHDVNSVDSVVVTAEDDTVAVGITGGGAVGGDAGVGAALDTAVIIKTVKAYIADDTDATDGRSVDVNATKEVSINADSSEVITSLAAGFAGGGKAGVGGAVSIGVVTNDVKAYIGKDATVDSDGNVLVNAEDDIVAVLLPATVSVGGQAGVGGALAVATLLGATHAYIGEGATVNARGNHGAATVIRGDAVKSGDANAAFSSEVDNSVSEDDFVNKDEDGNIIPDGADVPAATATTDQIKGLSVTAHNREVLVTTAFSAGIGGSAGVAGTLSANVIATNAEARIDRGAKINTDNTLAGDEQVVSVKALDETVLVNMAGSVGGGGSAGVGAAGNIGVIAKTTAAKVGPSSLINARKVFDLSANSTDVVVTGTMGFGGGGSAGVSGTLGALVFVNTTTAEVEDGASALEATKINVGDAADNIVGALNVSASEFSTLTAVTGAGAGGGSAGVGGALGVVVNDSTTRARIGNYAETNATGITSVHADSTENVNTVTVAGAGGGAAGVAGAVGLKVVVSHTEAGIGDYAKVNQNAAYDYADQSVDVKATDKIITVGAGGVGAGGGAAGVGGTADITVALNTTEAYIGDYAKVDAVGNVSVDASSAKYVNSATIAGGGGGAAGVTGAFGVIAVGSLLDGEASGSMNVSQEVRDAAGNTLDVDGNIVEFDDEGNQVDPNVKIAYEDVSTQEYADGQTTKSAVVDEDGKNMLGSSDRSAKTANTLDSYSSNLAVSDDLSANVPTANTTASIGNYAEVKAGGNVTVKAEDTALAIMAAGAGSGAGAAGVSGALGVVLLHDSAGAYIGDGAKVDADGLIAVDAGTSENVYDVGIAISGAGAAAVNGALMVNVVSSDTDAFIGAAAINRAGVYSSDEQAVSVTADSSTNIGTLAGSGGGAGAAAVGGVFTTNVLEKDTKAYISSGADVAAQKAVNVNASSVENVVSTGLSIRGAGAAAVGASASVNVITNETQAAIGDDLNDDNDTLGATVDSDGNLDLSATDDTLLIAVSAVGNGAGAAAVGVNVQANIISNKTRAFVADNSTVNARGNSLATMSILTGTVDTAITSTLPQAPAGESGNVDVNDDGVDDRKVNANGEAEFAVTAKGDEDSDSSTKTVNTGVAPKDDQEGDAVATNGLAKNVEIGARGFSIAAVSNEKVVTTTIGVAGAGAAAVTGSFSTNVITTETEASIGDNSFINKAGTPAGEDKSVRVTAADNTFMVQVASTFTGAGAAAVSGSANTAVVAKKTNASLGENTLVNADGSSIEDLTNNVAVNALSSEDLYTVTTNVSIAGGAGVGGVVGVNVVTNETTASVGAGTEIVAAGDLVVNAEEDTDVLMTSVSGAAGYVGVSGAVSVVVVDNTTKAYVAEGGAKLDVEGLTEIKADSTEKVVSVTGAAAGGAVGVAGAVSVKVIGSEAVAYIGDAAEVNQNSSGPAQDVRVTAKDKVSLEGGGGTAAIGIAGVGATADVNIVKNTTTAYIGDSALVDAGRDVKVLSDSTKDLNSTTLAASGGATLAIGGATSIITVGSSLDADT